MAVSYKKLWKMLIDKDMKKKRSLRESRYQYDLRHKDGQRWPCQYRGAC